ncbi:MAG TPA: hypothetical protein VOA78_01705 [Candidatus Dormibacteraeota bacterium]|nr:hypothetical protein [Candidatus Dormibacteraeota bacterium]
MFRSPHLRLVFVAILAACLTASGCVHPLGPGYLVEKQHIEVQFFPASPQKIRVDATYQLRNTGNRSLASLDARLPGGRRLHVAGLQVTWDGTQLEVTPSPDAPRNSIVDLPQNWIVSARHTLHLSYDVVSAAPEETGLGFANDAFFLPSANWNAEFLPSRGLFGFGGEPPGKWDLTVRVPQGFLVHTSGMNRKQSRKGGEEIARAVQTPADHYPFVVAGRYTSAEIGDAQHRVVLWARSQPDAGSLKRASQEIARTTAVYDGMFGSRTTKKDVPFWIVECPDARGCLSTSSPVASLLLGEDAAQSTAEMVSADTLMVDLSAGAPKLAATVAPSLAASWLGYGQNPGFYEQVPPLSLLPAFAAAIGRETLVGPGYRGEVIRRALRAVPGNSAARNTGGKPKEEDPGVVRAKSLLFFYALQDRYGPEVFRKAVTHMLEARRGRGFDISDLIASFEQETHQNIAEFVRLWMKRPGVPDDFRAQYESNSKAGNSVKETFR